MSTHIPKRAATSRCTPPRTPAEYIAGQQEANVQLTSLADMLKWAQNYARSRSIWPLGYGLACCAIEMITAAQAHYNLARFGPEVFRSWPARSVPRWAAPHSLVGADA
jgi:NADH:ubiquinone oxidoreductase subunit B-like Fe-S oxidoreductase